MEILFNPETITSFKALPKKEPQNSAENSVLQDFNTTDTFHPQSFEESNSDINKMKALRNFAFSSGRVSGYYENEADQEINMLKKMLKFEHIENIAGFIKEENIPERKAILQESITSVDVNPFLQPIIVEGPAGNDIFRINEDNEGNLTGVVNGKKIFIPKKDAKNVIFSCGDGNDTFITGKNVNRSLRISGGKGDDLIYGGNGKDTIVGGKGNDTIHAGSGDDKVFAMYGNDRIEGGKGNDYIDGGKGNDSVHGGKGRDTIYGGRGDDVLYGGGDRDFINGGWGDDLLEGGTGNDIIAAIDGRDRLLGSSGSDNIFASEEAQITLNSGDKLSVNSIDKGLLSRIAISGEQAFKDRINDDLTFLLSTKTGHKLLSELAKSKRKISILEEISFAGTHYESPMLSKPLSIITMNPSFTHFSGKAKGIPVNILFHELVHAYNQATNTMQRGIDPVTGTPLSELQAVGLDYDERYGDIMRYPDGTIGVHNPEGLTENSFNSEIGMEKRTSY